MSFILRIYLLGLLALIPSPDEDEMTVLVLDARHGAQVSDSAAILPHQPWLLVRAADCKGNCWGEAEESAAVEFFSRQPQELRRALQQGGFWALDHEELTISTGSTSGSAKLAVALNDESEPKRSWIVRMDQILPGDGQIDSRFLEDPAAGGRVIARLKLSQGKLTPYRFVTYPRLDQEPAAPVPLVFKTLDGQETAPLAPQLFADWLTVEIPVSGSEVEILGTSFNRASSRRMTLSPGCTAAPEGAVFEVVLLNLPQETFARPPANHPNPDPVGRHFAMYYDLLAKPPKKLLLPQVAPQSLQSVALASPLGNRQEGESMLLHELETPPRGSYSTPICPSVQLGGLPQPARARRPAAATRLPP